MDEVAVKQGLLYLQQQQTFGKKWRKFWAVLYRETPCSCAYLELYEGSGPPAPEKPKKAESGKKLIKLSNCVHVSEANGDTSSPKETVPFILERTPLVSRVLALRAITFAMLKWRKFWAVLYRETPCSCAYLELYEGSGPPAPEKPKKAESGKKLIKLSNCVHVSEANGDTSSPKETVPFILETTDKRYLLATDSTEVAHWVGALCEVAFARSREERKAPAGKDGQLGLLAMEENSLYSSTIKGAPTREFRVAVRTTESSERCQLWGSFLLRAEEEALELWDLQTGSMLYAWPYRFLRRFGRDKVTFSFEAGRRCTSGEGNFEFETTQGNEIFQVIESAINVQRGLGARRTTLSGFPCRLEGKPAKGKSVKPTTSCPLSGEPTRSYTAPADPEVPYAEPRDSIRLNPQGRAKTMERARKAVAQNKAAPECEYAVPFDTILPVRLLYDSIDEVGAKKRNHTLPHSKPEHIYDEPEGLQAHSVYDEPEEVRGEAWKLQATAEDPVGHEYPYNPQRDDYSVPKRAVPILCPVAGPGDDWLGETEYDNVALKFMKKNAQ
nr:docking protein 2 [Pelodiscus sinensis]|eukprot:XP_014435223.1 docking protein 2 [Pelodiscus sinensis]